MATIQENRLFVGNPGTGKSTLINCLLGGKHFRSGISWGGGLTQDFQRIERDGIAYMDTPGLADETILKQAAEAITTALKQGGSYKLFFMVRLQNGRVVSEDISTLERVLDSIDAGDLNFKFTVLMNCVAPRQYEVLKSRGDEFETIKRLVNHRYKTDSFCFVPLINELQEVEAVVDLPSEVLTFMKTEAPVICIEEKQVKAIDLDGFADQTQEIRRELEQLRKEQAKWLAAMHEQEKLHEAALQRERARYSVEIEKIKKVTATKDGPLSPVAEYFNQPITPPTDEMLEKQSPRWSTRKKVTISIVVVALLAIVAVIVVAIVTRSSKPAAQSEPEASTPKPSVLPSGCLYAEQTPVTADRYSWEVCFDAGIARQSSNLLPSVLLGKDMVYDPVNDPTHVYFKNGTAGMDDCPNGRELTIEIRCAASLSLGNATEPFICTYTAVLETPAIC